MPTPKTIFVFYEKYYGKVTLNFKPAGVFFSLLAGFSIGLASIFFMKMFALGTNLSVGIPVVRIGIVLLASFLGVVF